MSVYTVVDRADLAAWLAPLGVGELVSHAGIAAGVQNSNYFVTTADGEWVLTLFERLEAAELDFYLGLMAHLAGQGHPCPQPRRDVEGRLWRPLAGKPAALVSRLPGRCVEAPAAGHCRLVGQALGQLHRLAAGLRDPLPHPCGADWRQRTGERLLPEVAGDDRGLLADELAFQAAQDLSALPRGVVHADLFRDNALWTPDGRLSGVLDFYFAGEDCLLFDLAVAANDWCGDAASVSALLEGYAEERALTIGERQAWPAMRRAAALRFWLSRLEDALHPRPGAVVTVKDPGHFAGLLRALRTASIPV